MGHGWDLQNFQDDHVVGHVGDHEADHVGGHVDHQSMVDLLVGLLGIHLFLGQGHSCQIEVDIENRVLVHDEDHVGDLDDLSFDHEGQVVDNPLLAKVLVVHHVDLLSLDLLGENRKVDQVDNYLVDPSHHDLVDHSPCPLVHHSQDYKLLHQAFHTHELG